MAVATVGRSFVQLVAATVQPVLVAQEDTVALAVRAVTLVGPHRTPALAVAPLVGATQVIIEAMAAAGRVFMVKILQAQMQQL